MLKPALARGEVQCIGATTLDEYRKYIEKDGALERRFQTILVEPPSKHEALEILRGLRDRYEAHHRVQITDEALEASVDLSDRYITGRCLPDKAIDVVDEAGARVRLKAMTRPPDLKDLDEQIERLNQDKEEAVANQDFERAASLRDQADKLKKRKETITREWRERSKEIDGTVDEEVVAEVVSKMTGIPLTRLETEETARLLHMETGHPEEGDLADRGDQADQRGRAPQPGGAERPQAADRQLHLRRADRRRQNAARQGPGRIHVRRRRRADPDRHVRVHGEAQRLAVDRCAARATSATRKAASSPRRSAAGRMPWSCSTRSKKPTPTFTTPCSRSWRKAG